MRYVVRYVAPALGAVGLATGLWLMLSNFELLTGLTGWVNALLLAPMVVLAAISVVWAVRLRRRDPAKYTRIGQGTEALEVGGELGDV